MKIRPMHKNNHFLKAVIFDWAGTTVDFGCFAPTGVFIEVFKQRGIHISIDEARAPMGLHKRDHIREICQMPRIASEWKSIHGSCCKESDIEAMFNDFVPLQMRVLENYCQIVPGLLEAVEIIKSLDLKIGSTTGYNKEMMKIVSALAAKQGYMPDSVVCVSDVSCGRPAPWMAFKNAENLSIFPMNRIVKIGDTVADIFEGLNAGMWSVAVVLSSSEMGITLDQIQKMDNKELEKKKIAVREKFYTAGAHYVIDNLQELAPVLISINQRLANNEKP